MKLSIITINYNNREGLEKTIKSVLAQTYSNYEYIVIDGDSDDGSKEIIEKYKNSIDCWISEPDKNIYNAMNKGIRKSNGKYLLFLNSGDNLYEKDTISGVLNFFKTNFDIYYGNEFYMNKKIIVQPKVLKFSYLYHSSLRHQATFIKKSLFDKVFYYNEELKIVSDWEFLICTIFKHNATYQYINQTISIYEGDGISQQSDNLPLRNRERKLVLEKHFPGFIDDMNELIDFKRMSDSRNIELLAEIEKYQIGKLLSKIFFSVSLIFLKIKKLL